MKNKAIKDYIRKATASGQGTILLSAVGRPDEITQASLQSAIEKLREGGISQPYQISFDPKKHYISSANLAWLKREGVEVRVI